ncbi:component of the polarisome [Rhodotorula kratochvilovae]
MSLRNNGAPGPRPYNAPPADAFSYRGPNQQQQGPAPTSASPRPAPQPLNGSQQQQQQGLSQQGQPQQQQQQVQGSFVKPPPLSLEQSKLVAHTHYSALKGWLTKEGALASGSTRTNAREKLTRLTRQQFQELSTDVYDELMRRLDDTATPAGQQPFLAVRPDFHPKRNQARQKLATLPLLRFRDLASDVYFELDRRYPEFGEEDDMAGGQAFSTPQTGYGSSLHSRTGSLASSQHHALSSPPLSAPAPPSNLNARRAPTPTSAAHSASPSLASLGGAAAAVPAGNDVVVPNKSTMIVEEEPARSPPPMSPTSEDRRGSAEPRSPGALSSSSSSGPSSGSGAFSFGAAAAAGGRAPPIPVVREEDDEQQQRTEALTSPPPSARLQARAGAGEAQNRASEVSSAGTSSRFFGGYAGSAAASEVGGRRSWEHDAADKVRAEYEYKLAMLQNRVSELEREAGAGGEGERRVREQWEQERRRWEQRSEEQQSQYRALQREHETLRSRGLSPSGPSSSSAGDAQLRARLHEAEELAAELRGEVSSLVDEVRQVNERAEELQGEVERERDTREKAEKEAREWKERWQAAKLELRNVKATSMLFTSSISVDADWLPASSDGLINDTSIAAFQTSIDDLLQAARSKEPSSVLPAARAVVQACTKVDNDVQAIAPSRLASLPFSEQDLVNSLKVKINATLSNLLTACKNHATSFGVSPVSLLDAAASHLAATVVELVRILKIRRTTGPSSSGRGGVRSSLDPSAAFGFRNGHDPLPSLREDAHAVREEDEEAERDDDAPRGLSISVPADAPAPNSPAPPALPAKEQQAREADKPKERSPGYLSGGMSSLLEAGSGSVKHALGAIGLGGVAGSDRSAGKRGSVETVSDRGGAGNARASVADSFGSPTAADPYGGEAPAHQQQQHAYSHDGGSAYSRSHDGGSPYEARAQLPPQQHSYGSYIADGRHGAPAFEYGAEFQDGPEHAEQLRDGYDAQGRYSSYEDEQRQHEQHGGEAYGVGSPGMRGQERDPEELRAYIENQTEAIVHSIQSLLSAIRSGAQTSELNDNLTQIITIVSSIVAISQEALPHHARDEGDDILQDLTTHCDKLSEMQSADHAAAGAFTKQTKQAMAAASFGVAKQLKALNALLSSGAGDE